MSNNRIYLMHRQSQKAVFLGKRLGEGWFDVPDDIKQRIEDLFKEVDLIQSASITPIQDDFCVALEDASNATMAIEAPQSVLSGSGRSVFTSDILANMPVSRWIEMFQMMPQDVPLKIEFAGEQYPVLDVVGPHAGNDNLVLVVPTKAEMSLRRLLTSNRIARQKGNAS